MKWYAVSPRESSTAPVAVVAKVIAVGGYGMPARATSLPLRKTTAPSSCISSSWRPVIVAAFVTLKLLRKYIVVVTAVARFVFMPVSP